jgi:hypothetical protein
VTEPAEKQACWRCRYDLAGLDEDSSCPECGADQPIDVEPPGSDETVFQRPQAGYFRPEGNPSEHQTSGRPDPEGSRRLGVVARGLAGGAGVLLTLAGVLVLISTEEGAEMQPGPPMIIGGSLMLAVFVASLFIRAKPGPP